MRSKAVSRDLITLSLAQFFQDFGTGMYLTLIPLYIKELATDIQIPLTLQAGLVISIFGVFMSLSQPLAGRLIDQLNRRKPFVLAGIASSIVFSIMYAHITTFEQLLVIRVFQGITVGVTIPAILVMVTSLTRPGTRGLSMGVYSTIRGVGFGMGPLVGGGIATYFGFDNAFYAIAIFSLISLLLMGFVADKGDGRPARKGSGNSVKPDVLWLAFAMFMMILGIMVVVALLPEYQVRLGASELMLGAAISAYTLTRLIFQTPMGALSDRIGRKKLIITGMILTAPIVLALGFVTSIYQFIALRILQGLTVVAIDTPTLALAADLAEDGRVGQTMSLITTAFTAGMAVGPIFSGILAGYVYFEFPFYLCALMMLLGAFMIYQFVGEPVLAPALEESLDTA